MLEALTDVWSDELTNDGRIELENFLVLKVKSAAYNTCKEATWMEKVTLSRTLGDALGFTSADLEANYAGYLTESQRQRQGTRMIEVLLAYGAFTCFSGAFCFSFVRDYLNQYRRQLCGILQISIRSNAAKCR